MWQSTIAWLTYQLIIVEGVYLIYNINALSVDINHLHQVYMLSVVVYVLSEHVHVQHSSLKRATFSFDIIIYKTVISVADIKLKTP